MRVKTQHCLQPVDIAAHSVVLEDDLGNPIFVAVQLKDSIVYSSAGDSDFHSMLSTLGINKTVTVSEFKPKPAKNIIWTP
jgi:hypothetical protein